MNSSRFSMLSVSVCALCVAMSFCFGSESSCHAQRLSQFRAEQGPIQYAPNDPLTRGRLFNLQTGHAGAFYDCNGEESQKRHSPFIRWQSSPEKLRHGTFEDVLQWGRERAEIAQRICDGAGSCCSGSGDCQSCQKATEAAPAPCGCQGCVAGGKVSAETRLASEASVTKGYAGLLVGEEPRVEVRPSASASLLDRTHSARRFR